MSSIRRLSAVTLVCQRILTLAAALIGGNLFGLVGMIFFIPIFAVIYRFVKEWVEKHEQAASVVAVGGIIDEEN